MSTDTAGNPQPRDLRLSPSQTLALSAGSSSPQTPQQGLNLPLTFAKENSVGDGIAIRANNRLSRQRIRTPKDEGGPLLTALA
ncbi:MAG: hypothetical protein BWY63_03565 [Chloroflexi bacterium ADurb.Bin360]|nr:MAG: hypothetical protein BWY63_03565 [Chloroflexi bacterium ADurb.Bin360]